ncbi:unnamed protein product [marine sediment metagenome]|uniref:Uncharacterized protein n=1 Tax=marine sediment metagenome TaxID=412755 RepID=X1IYQ5_9ZZZZ
MRVFEMRDYRLWQVVNPKRLTEEQIEMGKYKLGSGKKTESWMAETGGVNGESFGIEANAFTPKQIEEIFLGYVGDRLKKVEEPEEREAGRLEEIERSIDVIVGINIYW